MTISTKAYCDNPTCTATTSLLRGEQVIAPHWVIANIADINGEWYEGSPAHAMHFCGDNCYQQYTALAPSLEQEMAQAWKEMTVDFMVDNSRDQEKST